MKTREELLKEFEEEPTAKKFSKSDKVIHFTPEELQQILSAPTKAQMECPYCHGGRKAKPVIETSSDFLAFDKNGTLAFGNDGSVEIFAGFTKFHYCPQCGRKLEE